MARPKKTITVQAEPVQTSSSETQLPVFTPEEIQAVLALRAGAGNPTQAEGSGSDNSKYGLNELAQALMQALNAVKPVEKKNVMTRKKRNPWMPTDGSPKILEFKRPMYQHGLEIDPKYTKNETCKLLGQIKPGTYCDKLVTVRKRKNGGYDIDYSIRTAAQRLKLTPYTSGKGLDGLLERIILERANPKLYRQAGDDDDDD